MNEAIKPFLDAPLRELVAPIGQKLELPDRERHRIYAGSLAAIIRYYWCGNKYGLAGDYPMNPKSAKWSSVCPHLGNEYRGHNIAALAVDHDGYIIDFDFNHNTLYDSSAEHAEGRLVRRLFSLTQLQDAWNIASGDNPSDKYSNALSRVTIYTSLEPCTQCTGIMMLGRVRSVIYLQSDPDMYRICNFLYTLTTLKKKPDFIRSPEPLAASRFGMRIQAELDEAYRQFVAQKKSGPYFHRDTGGEIRTSSITSFLCTEWALEKFSKAADAFNKMRLKHRDYRPCCDDDSDESIGEKLDNAGALKEAKQFVEYATEKGHRGTPHR